MLIIEKLFLINYGFGNFPLIQVKGFLIKFIILLTNFEILFVIFENIFGILILGSFMEDGSLILPIVANIEAPTRRAPPIATPPNNNFFQVGF